MRRFALALAVAGYWLLNQQLASQHPEAVELVCSLLFWEGLGRLVQVLRSRLVVRAALLCCAW
jgi:hypothetical protein